MCSVIKKYITINSVPYIVQTYSSNVRTSHGDIDISNCPSLACNSSLIIFALCMSSSQVMYKQLNTQLFVGILLYNIIVLVYLKVM